MSEPCRQEDAIDDIRLTLQRVAAALETVAAQGEAIRFLNEQQRDQKKSIDSIYSRLRAIELQPARELSKVKVAVVSSLLSAICSGAASFIIAHMMK